MNHCPHCTEGDYHTACIDEEMPENDWSMESGNLYVSAMAEYPDTGYAVWILDTATGLDRWEGNTYDTAYWVLRKYGADHQKAVAMLEATRRQERG